MSKSRENRMRLLLLVVSLLVSIAFAEVAVRILGLGTPKIRQGSGGFTFFTHHPELGWDLVPGTEDRFETAEFDVTVRITEQGLRSHRTFPSKPPDGTRRVVVLGDSFSFGHGVEVEEAWPARLESLLPQPVEVVNLSVTGYGTDQQLLRFEDRGLGLEADQVILGLFVGNIFRNARKVQIGYPKPRFVVRGGELELTGVPVPEKTPPPGPFRLWNLTSSSVRGMTEHLGYGEAWTVTERILERLRRRSDDMGAELLVAILPKDQLIYGSGRRRQIHQRTLNRTHRMLQELDIPYLDLTEPLRAAAADEQAPRLYYPVDGHWTPTGHQVAAEELAQRLSSDRGAQNIR